MNVLIVDDHPMTIDLYENILLNNSEFISNLNITKALNCKDAFEAYAVSKINKSDFDLALIDYSLPIYKEKNILSGGDVANLIKSDGICKVIIITAQTQLLVVYDILKKIKPEGMVIKSDVTTENFMTIINTVIEGNLYQSPIVKTSVKEIWKKEIMADEMNRQIMLLLAKGYKIKKIEIVLMLSVSAIQRRIAQMKDAFDVKEDSSLVEEAMYHGFL